MSDFREVTRSAPCPACGKDHWCAWTKHGWLKCERATTAPTGMALVKLKDGGALFKPANADGCSPKHRIVATYPYLDEKGVLLFETVRFEPKDFRQRRPNGNGGWIWNLNGVPRVLYRLPELILAGRDKWVFIVEGEKDVETLRAIELIATTNPCGAGKFHHVDATVLHGCRICVLADNDEKGRQHAQQVAFALHGKVATLRVLDLPGLPPKGDVSDWLAAGGTAEQLMALVETAPEWQPTAQTDEHSENAEGDQSGNEGEKKRSQATILTELGTAAELFKDGDEAFATITVGDHVETWRIRSRHFKRWLAARFFEMEDRAPSSQAMADAIGVIEGNALFRSPEHRTHVRVAHVDGAIYLDLGDDKWRSVVVRADGWQVLDRSPVRFRRAKGMLALPEPVAGGSVAELRQFLNVGSDSDFMLLVAWLVSALRPEYPMPVLLLNGEQGSAKSTAAKLLRELIDPNLANLRSEPREPRDLMIAANNGWVAAFDNLSRLPAWLSDAICRLSTGGGFGTRTLYENDEETIFDALRPVLITSIEDVATRADLLDRCLRATLQVIPDDRRRTERELMAAFHGARPRILGALLDAVSAGLRNIARVKLNHLPRMADFAQWIVAAEDALPWPKGEFMRVYAGNRIDAQQLALEESLIAEPVIAFMSREGHWTGTMSDLLKSLAEHAEEATTKRKDWPTKAHVLSGQLRRIAPSLRIAGVDIQFDERRGRQRKRLVTLIWTRQGGENSGPSVHVRPQAQEAASERRSEDTPAGHADAHEPAFVTSGTHVDAADADSQDVSAGEDTEWKF